MEPRPAGLIAAESPGRVRHRGLRRIPVAIVFSDMEGSTALNELLGDKLWFSVLAEHDQIVRDQVQCHDGLEVKRLGDGFMLAFANTIDALECAVSIQRGIAERNRSKRPEIRVRIGVHAGTPIYEARDFFGRDVTLAARVAAHAKAGEILVARLAPGPDPVGLSRRTAPDRYRQR